VAAFEVFPGGRFSVFGDNYTMNPAVGVGLGADFVRTLAHRGLW
jgi:hypothetical protein